MQDETTQRRGAPALADGRAETRPYSRRAAGMGVGAGTGNGAGTTGPLPDRRAARRRGLLAGVPRPRPGAEPRRRAEGAGPGGRSGREPSPELREGSAGARTALAPQHRGGLRRGRGRWVALYRDGVPAGWIAQAPDRDDRTAHAWPGGPRDDRARDRARVRALEGDHPRRPETLEHPLRRDRSSQDLRLRDRAGSARGCGVTAALRDRDVRRAGARGREERLGSVGHLWARPHPVRVARRETTFHELDRCRAAARSRRAPAGAAEPSAAFAAEGARRRRPQGTRQTAPRALPESQ